MNAAMQRHLADLMGTKAFTVERLAPFANLTKAKTDDPNAFNLEIASLSEELLALPAKALKAPQMTAMSVLYAAMQTAEEMTPSTTLPSMAELNARPGKRDLRPGGGTKRANLVDGRGHPLENVGHLMDAFNALPSQLRQMKDGGRVQLAHADWRDAYPEDRKLGMNESENSRKLAAVDSLVASGGVCGPVAVDYALPFFSTANRPLRDALPSFNADRGGVRFILPAAFTSASGATALWTEAIDLAPGGLTKPVATLSCQSPQEAYVSAVPTRLKMGNMQGRFFPEQIENWTETALAYAARFAELNLLSIIATNSTLVSSGQLLGATRDLLATVDQACAAYRYRTRIPRSQKLTIVFPDWIQDLFRADITRQTATGTASDDSLAMSEARMDSWFSVRGLTPIFTLDAAPAVSGGINQVNQAWGAQTPNAALLGWPTQLSWYLFATGTFQFLDGGTLDLSVIRDSTLDATNDYETMIETFENVIFRGLESLQIVSSIRPNGASAGTVTTATTPVVY